MRNIILAISILFSLGAFAQRESKVSDSTRFTKGVRFDSTLVFKRLKAAAAKDTVLVIMDANGTVSKINKSNLLSGISGGGTQTLSISGDTLSISDGNSVVLPVYVQADSSTISSYEVLNSQNAPPGSPSTGDVYLVGTSPTGAWVGHAKDIAEWNGSGWVFTDGVQGDFLYNATNALTYIFRSGNWVQTTGIPALNNGNTISSGLRIGTNNARSLTFETNNVNRGRIDSVGRFYVYNLPTSSTSDTFVTKSDLSGKLTKVGQSTFLSGVNTSLFPNGIKIITDTDYKLSSADAGYDLVAINHNTHFTMPDPCPFSVGDIVGLSSDLDKATFDINSITQNVQLYTGEFAENGETLIMQCVDVGGGAEMLPLSAIIDDNGTLKTLNKYLYDKSQNAIPLSGTEVGKPVTDDIEFKSGYDAVRLYKTNEDEDIVQSISFNDSHLEIKGTNVANTQNASIKLYADNVTIEGTGIGLRGGIDYSPNITDLDYTQKIYVDQRISDTATQIRSEIPDVSNFATITNLADTASSLHTLIDAKVSASGTATLTNKRITARVDSTTSSATPSINTDNVDTYKLTAQAADITSFTTNLSGTPTDDQILHIVIIGTATRAITWGSKFEASTVALPTTTVSTDRLDVYFVWNTFTSKWRCGGVW